MLYTKSVGKSVDVAETCDKRVGKAVGDLQAHTYKGGEDKEHRHLVLLEKLESVETKRLGKRFLALVFLNLASRQRERITSEHHAENAAYQKLMRSSLEFEQVNNPHANDKSHSAERSDGRKMLNGVQLVEVERVVSHRKRQRERRHIKRNSEEVERIHHAHLCVGAGVEAVHAERNHSRSRYQVAYSVSFLRLNPSVGNDAYDCGHKQRRYALCRIEQSDAVGKTV